VTIQHVRPNVFETLERVLDKGIVIDASVRLMVGGIDLLTVEALVIVASLESYVRYSDAVKDSAPHLSSAVAHRRTQSRGAKEPGSLGVVRQVFDAWNEHDVKRYAALLDDAYVGETHGFPLPLRGRTAASHAMDAHLKILPDSHFTIEGAIATGNNVFVSWLATGTPRDQYSGANLTARPLRVAGCTVTRVSHGKIAHTWNYWDMPTSCN